MSTDDSSFRVGNDERQAAIAALGQEWQAGRLDPAEHERRTTAAYGATTRADLDALFTDLPGGRSPASAPVATPAATSAPSGQEVSTRSGGGLFAPDSWMAQHRDVLMGVTPFVGLALFFITRSWLFFLLVPAMGVILYAGDDGKGRRRDRNRRE